MKYYIAVISVDSEVNLSEQDKQARELLEANYRDTETQKFKADNASKLTLMEEVSASADDDEALGCMRKRIHNSKLAEDKFTYVIIVNDGGYYTGAYNISLMLKNEKLLKLFREIFNNEINNYRSAIKERNYSTNEQREVSIQKIDKFTKVLLDGCGHNGFLIIMGCLLHELDEVNKQHAQPKKTDNVITGFVVNAFRTMVGSQLVAAYESIVKEFRNDLLQFGYDINEDEDKNKLKTFFKINEENLQNKTVPKNYRFG